MTFFKERTNIYLARTHTRTHAHAHAHARARINIMMTKPGRSMQISYLNKSPIKNFYGIFEIDT